MPSSARYDIEVHNKVIALISPLAALARRTCPLHFCATAPEKPPIKQYGKNIKNDRENKCRTEAILHLDTSADSGAECPAE